jgi:hypothetical protein
MLSLFDVPMDEFPALSSRLFVTESRENLASEDSGE